MAEFFDSAAPPADDVWQMLERKLGPWPPAYKAAMARVNGGCPMPMAVTYFDPDDHSRQVGVDCVQTIFPVRSISSGLGAARLARGEPQSQFQFTADFPTGLVAVADAPAWGRPLIGHYFVLSCRPEDFGVVYFYIDTKGRRRRGDKEYEFHFDPTKLFYVAPDFEAFLAWLHWPPGCVPWVEAIERGDEAAVAKWLAENPEADVDAADPAWRLSPMLHACWGNIVTPDDPATEAACLAILRRLAARSRKPEAMLAQLTRKTWPRIEILAEHIQSPNALKKLIKELKAEEPGLWANLPKGAAGAAARQAAAAASPKAALCVRLEDRLAKSKTT